MRFWGLALPSMVYGVGDSPLSPPPIHPPEKKAVYESHTTRYFFDMNDTLRNWIVVGLALGLGAIGGYTVARSTVSQWHQPPPPPELLEANRTILEHCVPAEFRTLTCPDRTDVCMCRPIPPEWLE